MPINWDEFDKKMGLKKDTKTIQPKEQPKTKGKIDREAFDKMIAEQQSVSIAGRSQS